MEFYRDSGPSEARKRGSGGESPRKYDNLPTQVRQTWIQSSRLLHGEPAPPNPKLFDRASDTHMRYSYSLGF
jgi:hypothetical protein